MTSDLNGVNLGAIGSLVEKIREQPGAAKTEWKSEVRWTGGFRSESRSRNLPAAASDEPAGLGGGDTAANPVEQLLAALGNCLAVGYAANASVMGIEMRSLKIDLDGTIDMHTFLGLGGDNAGYDTIHAKVAIDADASPEKIRELHQKVVGSSPVGHTLARAVQVQIDLA
jgi:uncharacterized OsmC-like protein